MNWENMMEKLSTDAFSDISAAISTVAVPTLNAYHKIIPMEVKSPMDLLRIKTREPFRWREAIYHLAKRQLFELDRTVDGFIDEMIRVESIEINEVWKSIESFKDLHDKAISSFRVDIEKAYKWFDDDVLLSTILFHINLTDIFISRLNKEAVKRAITNIGKMLEITRKHRDLCKSAVMLLLEPLLVFSVLTAFRKKDYNFILKYEKEVLNAARTISDFRPEIIKAIAIPTKTE